MRAEFPCINGDYEEYLLKSFDETYFPEKLVNAGRAVYVERNCEMIDNSSCCVVYYDENYTPKRRKNRKKDVAGYQPISGTKRAYEHAQKQNVCAFNMREE